MSLWPPLRHAVQKLPTAAPTSSRRGTNTADVVEARVGPSGPGTVIKQLARRSPSPGGSQDLSGATLRTKRG
eukprot:9487371-Pyramimonas_sp.AAC.1